MSYQSTENNHVQEQDRAPEPAATERPESSSTLESQPLLDPDDPQVSVLKLEKIKLLKITTEVLVYINFILLIVLLASDFFAIPGFNYGSKSFLGLDLVILCLLVNFLNKITFVVPAYYERILGYIISSLLFLDLIVILLVPGLRQTYGILGNLLLLWTGLNTLLNSFIDYWVEQGTNYQQIRLTGRVEKRKTVGELFVIFIKTLFQLFLLWVVWCISLTIWLSAFDTHEKPWGKLVPVNNNQFKVHLACFGDMNNGTQPIVLVEGGQLTSSEAFQEWIEELYHLNKIERYCIWDRPGYGFSDSAPPPQSIGIITEYLIEALRTEKINGPFAVVGFDIGGLYARMFANRNRANIQSILFVDSWHPDLLKRWPFNGKKNESTKVFKGSLEVMDNIQGFKLWAKGFISPLGIKPSLHWFLHPMKFSSKSRIFGRDMYYQSKYLRARCQEQLVSGILSYNEITQADINGLQVGVISSDFMIKKSLNWGKWQRELGKLSDRTAEWVIAENSDHFIWKSAKGRAQLSELLLRLIGERKY
ncbi:unnamed protein product [Candida verbasci]|uniref:AB hydrolase-1 domain-containing protein n=1 Tax=Candida verbasci TaxID=1227364 RepID=A0A9W4U126_9ASCO|nr:unnamed protein product [Candida verbasci]